jgi:hypothetical protein
LEPSAASGGGEKLGSSGVAFGRVGEVTVHEPPLVGGLEEADDRGPGRLHVHEVEAEEPRAEPRVGRNRTFVGMMEYEPRENAKMSGS